MKKKTFINLQNPIKMNKTHFFSTALFLVVFSLGCSSIKNFFYETKNAKKEDFSVAHNVVHYKGKPYAELQAMTWSLDDGELVREMNFKLLEKEDLSIIGGMIDYLSDRHRGDEIEIEFEVEHNSDKFKL
jgi:hypothetical protein